MKFTVELNPLTVEVTDQYISLRKQGKNRTDAISLIQEGYSADLNDVDNRIFVLLGIAIALCKKKELTHSLASEALTEIAKVRKLGNIPPRTALWVAEVEALLTNDDMKGVETHYKKQKVYKTDWSIGDAFFHTLTHPKAKELGIYGWNIILCKAGDFQDSSQRRVQLMYVFLCEPNMMPSTTEQLQSLGFLRMMNHDEKWDYLVQLAFKSKKDERSYELTKFGNFPGLKPPLDSTEENPLCTMPLFGYLHKGAERPDYEDQICRLYRKYMNTGV